MGRQKIMDKNKGEKMNEIPRGGFARADQYQIGGTHYKAMTIQPWAAMEAWMTHEQFKGFLLGSAIAYLARFNSEGAGKGGVVDLQKASHYLEKLIELEDKAKEAKP